MHKQEANTKVAAEAAEEEAAAFELAYAASSSPSAASQHRGCCSHRQKQRSRTRGQAIENNVHLCLSCAHTLPATAEADDQTADGEEGHNGTNDASFGDSSDVPELRRLFWKLYHSSSPSSSPFSASEWRRRRVRVTEEAARTEKMVFGWVRRSTHTAASDN